MVAGIKDISLVWSNIKEVDLKPIRESATLPIRIVVVGEPGSGKHTLAEQMRNDPERPGVHTQTPITLLTINTSAEPPLAHLIIMIMNGTRDDFSTEQALVKKWGETGKNVLVFVNKIDQVENQIVGDLLQGWQVAQVLYGSTKDVAYLQREFVPLVLELLPNHHLALGRQFPLFRMPIARQLINDTCFSNAAYSFSTGVAEIIPVLDIPLNLTDMIVLTKSQAFLAYKLGLLFGFSTHWQDYVTEFGGVIGGGFLWRQIARQLIGLIPVWGIVPKVAISYSGTYVVGNAILGWYLTGRHLNAKQMRALSSQAFSRGKEYARKLGGKFPRPRLSKRKQEKLPPAQKIPELNQGEIIIVTGNGVAEGLASEENTYHANQDDKEQNTESKNAGLVQRTEAHKRLQEKRQRLKKNKSFKSSEAMNIRTCIKCGKTSSEEARFCQYCGNPFNP